MRALAACLFLAIAPAAAAAPSLTLAPCKVAGEVARCGALDVPEDGSRPGGRRIAVNVIVLPKTGDGPAQAPLVSLDGGPGIAGTNAAPLFATELRLHRARRDVVLFDQRGTGRSNPLHCEATEHRSALEDMWTPERVAACRRDLEARADLARYTTAVAARDVDALRQALGAPKVDLMGLSYGTMLAQAYMKLYPAHVRAAVLMGTVPLGEKLPLHHAANGEAALRQLFADCAADPACHGAYPDLARDWARLVARLDQGGVAAVDAQGRAVEIRKGPFAETLRSMLNTTPGQRRLPKIVAHAARGDFGPFFKAARGGEPEADGLYLSVTCPEGTRRIRGAEIDPAVAGSTFGRWRIDQQQMACRGWPPTVADPRVLTPLQSPVPVLLLAGGRDATTPVAWARRVAAGLPNGRVVVMPPVAHLPADLANIGCVDRMADAFFAKGSAEGLDTSCVATMTPPPFEVG